MNHFILAKICEETLKPEIANKDIIYFDYPIHYNIGDIAIMFGALELFKKLNSKIIKTFNIYNFSSHDLSRTCKKNTNAVIVMNGGGNFGDIYPKIHSKRIEVISKKSIKNKIIIMPSSIHYSDSAHLKIDAAVFEQRESGVRFFVRDNSSFSTANSFSNVEVSMCPDTAHMLDTTQFANPKANGALCLARTDNESTNSITSENFDKVIDWPSLINAYDTLILRSIRYFCIFEKITGITMPSYSLWKRQANIVLNRGLKEIAKYENITTDRLHACILSSLLGVRHKKILDNNYGKISSYLEAWN